jgi:hypothetical protein
MVLGKEHAQEIQCLAFSAGMKNSHRPKYLAMFLKGF